MIHSLVVVSLLLGGWPNPAQAFLLGRGDTVRPTPQPLCATKNNQPDPKPLSGLVSDMLSHYQAQTEDLAEVAKATAAADTNKGSGLPQADKHGIYRIVNQDQLENLLADNPDKLVILKFSAPWCQACRALAEKYKPFISKMEKQFRGPTQSSHSSRRRQVVFADISCSSQQAGMHCDTLGVLHLPSVQFYAATAGGVHTPQQPLESFRCGPDQLSWTQLQQKMTRFVEERKDVDTTSQPVASVKQTGLVAWGRKAARRINPFGGAK